MLNPPFKPKFSRTSRSPAVSKGGCVYYPMWLAYATGVLEKAGHKVKLLDAPAEGKNRAQTLKIAKRFKPELCALDTSTASIFNDLVVAEKLKDATGCFTAMMGTHVSALPEWTLQQNAAVDAVAVHEYDYTLRELAEELGKKKPNLAKVKGLVYRSKGKIIRNESRPFIKNLDELPFVSAVYKKHLNPRNYFYPANLYPEITIVTGRGCPFRCTYCVLPQTMFSRSYRTRSIESVIAELKYIKKAFPKAKEVFFEDDTLTANPYRVREMCDAMLKEDLQLTWSTNARADVDFFTLKKMKKSGCRLLCVGIESGSQEILNNIRKGTRIETIRRFMADAKRAGILVHGCFMLGNKGETKETIRKTIDFAKELDPDTAQFFPIMVYPGTEAYEYFRREGFLVSEDYAQWVNEEGSHNCMVSRPWLSSRELVQLCDMGRREFYLRPKFLAGKVKEGLADPKEFMRLAKGGKTFLKYIVRGTK